MSRPLGKAIVTNKCVQHHIESTRTEEATSGSGRGQLMSETVSVVSENEVVLGRAHQPPQRRPMEIACHHLETIIK